MREAAAAAALGVFERWLSLWVALCIVAGIALGHLWPAPFAALSRMEIAQVNLPVGVLIWAMIIPMLLRIDFGALHQVAARWRGIGVTLFITWAVKPFTMARLGWIFIRHLFAPWLPPAQADGCIAGPILLAAARCTAMVFVWSWSRRSRGAGCPGGARRRSRRCARGSRPSASPRCSPRSCCCSRSRAS
jgi:arsenite transporter